MDASRVPARRGAVGLEESQSAAQLQYDRRLRRSADVRAAAHGRRQRAIPLPMLAAEVPTLENGGISRDGMTITYHLRKDARWTDGVPVTSADVKWSWQAIMNPDNNVVSRHGYDFITSIDTPNATHGGRAPQAAILAIREHVLRRERSAIHARAGARRWRNIQTSTTFRSTAGPTVSDGPFKFVQWARGDHITLVRNDALLHGQARPEPGRGQDHPRRGHVGQSVAYARDRLHVPGVAARPIRRCAGARREDRLGERQWLCEHPAQLLAPGPAGPARAARDRVRTRQERARSDAHVRHAEGRDGGHPGLDVGVQSGGALVSARPRDGAAASA